MAIEFEPMTGNIGALVHGVDFAATNWERHIPEIEAGLFEHLVLVFPVQKIAPEEHVRLGRLLGELEPRHPLYPIVDGLDNLMVIENGPERPPDNEVWHADMTFRPVPPHCSLLQAKVLPSRGGDTMFCNMYAVYEALSPAMQAFLGELSATHDVRCGFREALTRNRENARLEALDRMPQADSRSSHPVIAVHPATGRKYVNVNESFTEAIDGLSEAESRRILALLYEQLREPRYQLRHRWSVDDLVIWDNLATQHFAVGDYSEYRRMHRVTVRQFATPPARLMAV